MALTTKACAPVRQYMVGGLVPAAALVFGLASAIPVLADYLVSNRTVTIREWRRLQCHYQAVYDPAEPGWWGCYLNLYYPPDSTCPSANSVVGYFTTRECGWPEPFCRTVGCTIAGPTASIVGCREGETGCRAVPRTVGASRGDGERGGRLPVAGEWWLVSGWGVPECGGLVLSWVWREAGDLAEGGGRRERGERVEAGGGWGGHREWRRAGRPDR